METRKSLVKRVMMISSAVLISTVALTSCKKDNTSTTTAKSYTISGNANGAQMVPSVAGNGSGTITGTYNPNTRVLNYTTNWSNLTGAPTSGGFYYGASGVNGTAVGSPWTMNSGWTGTGNLSGSMTLTADQATQLTSGNWYYTMGTASNSNGEIRGQITAAQQQ
jgi:hypothetical protein